MNVKIKYLGYPYGEAEVAGVGLVKTGDVVEVPEELAKALLQQRGWTKTSKSNKRPAATSSDADKEE